MTKLNRIYGELNFVPTYSKYHIAMQLDNPCYLNCKQFTYTHTVNNIRWEKLW